MKVVLVLLLSVTVAVAAPQDRWINGYDQYLHYQCPSHQSISMVISMHDNKYEDRVWDFSCQNTFSAASCSWTGYVNDFDQKFTFICPFGSVISGMESYHDDKTEDRRWKFLCCQGEVPATRNCKWSGYVNDFDAYLRWDASPNKYLTGVQSYHDNYKEDRRWNFHSCEKSA